MRRFKLIIICCSLLLTGCINNRYGEANVKKANSIQNSFSYKQNVDCEWGKLSAIYCNRIYYFQNDDEPGIYSMDTRGKSRQLEVAISNIRKLQVRDDGIYFAGPIENDNLNRYTLYIKKWGEENAEEYFEDSEEYPYEEQNVWDFFIDNDNTLIVIDAYAEIPVMNLAFRAFLTDSKKEPITFLDYKNNLEDYVLENIDENKMSLFSYNNIFIMSKTGLESRRRDSQGNLQCKFQINMDENNMTVFHKERNEILFFRNQEIYNDRLFDSVLQTIYNNEFVLSVKNDLVWIAEGTETVSDILELPEAKAIKYSIREGNELIVIAQGEEKELVYKISLDTKEIKSVFPLGEEQQVLSVYGGKLYAVSKEALYVYEEEKEEYRQTDSVKWEKQLKDENKLEMAGNVVFVYEVARDGDKFQLKEFQVLDS